ncbi:MAG: DUF1223 domain-containing protein [Rhodocyclales bacterium]|nr:DUF1223 domain-containing protein [Rhodocyclales bacterium]
MKIDRPTARLLSCFAAAMVSPAFAASTTCTAQSGERRGVLLELYTSEGCDSCPPADRRLSRWKTQAGFAGRLVPLAFHVDYWDRLGWIDRFASSQYTQRQYAMAALARSRAVYTPQFLRNGRDWRSGGDPLEGAADLLAGAAIALELNAARGGQFEVSGTVTAAKPGSEVWLALYENNLESQVRAGENSGKTLRHDYVVRRLIGPLNPNHEGRLALRQQIALDAGWKRADLGVAVFVQDKASGEILQAVQRHACAA